MARIFQPTTEEEAAWKKRVASGPAIVRAVGERLDPWSLYRMKSTGDRVTLRGISADGTVHVDVTGDYNYVLLERTVFGVDPNDLEPCEIPSPDEPVGSVLTHEQFEENIEALRVLIRPDLFVMGDDGIAKRKSRARRLPLGSGDARPGPPRIVRRRQRR
jgi:hypothetical protein